jgi:hypothetical protein
MCAGILAIGLILIGQVTSGNQRYPAAPPPGVSNSGNAGSGATNGSGGLAPIAPPPATGANSSQSAVTPIGSGTTPYESSSPTNTGNNQRLFVPFNSNTPAQGGGQPASAFPPASGAAANSTTSGDSNAAVKPSTMIRAMLTAPKESQLLGTSVTLLDVVGGASSRLEQTQRIETYWDLCSSLADYYLGLREQEELQELRSLVQRTGPTWQQAEAEMAVRVSTAQKAALAAQLRLATAMGRGSGNLPLPADMPHCGSYSTHFDQIFAGRPSTEARELAALLPLRYAELKAAAAAIPLSEQWARQVARNDSDGTGTLRALEFLALRRRAFVQIARDYNRRIARYSELATPGQVGSERLIGMLIKREDATAARPFLQGAPLNRNSSDESASRPKTFADEGWSPLDEEKAAAAIRDGEVKATSAESTVPAQPSTPKRERSLLVPAQ